MRTWSVWEQNTKTLAAIKVRNFNNRICAKEWIQRNGRLGYEYYVLHSKRPKVPL